MGNIDKDLQEIIDVISDGVQTTIKQLEDGFQYTDVFAFVPVLSNIPKAIEGNENAWTYLKDMTEEKENALVEAVAEKLNDYSEFVKTTARRLIRLAAEAYMTVMHFANKAA